MFNTFEFAFLPQVPFLLVCLVKSHCAIVSLCSLKNYGGLNCVYKFVQEVDHHPLIKFGVSWLFCMCCPTGPCEVLVYSVLPLTGLGHSTAPPARPHIPTARAICLVELPPPPRLPTTSTPLFQVGVLCLPF